MLFTDKTSPILALILSSRQTEDAMERQRGSEREREGAAEREREREQLLITHSGSNHVGSSVIGLAPSARQRRGSLQGQRKSGLPHTSPVQ